MNTHKVRALVATIAAGFLQFLESMASVPPEVQDGLLMQLVETVPITWRPNVILYSSLLKWLIGAYAVHQASKSGPESPPANNPNK